MMLLSLFGARRIALDQLEKIEQNAPDIIVWAAPAMFFFALLEFIISYLQDRKYYEKKETLGSIAVGLGNVGVSALLKITILYIAICIYNLVPWRMELNWWTFLPCYIIFDF